MKILFVCSGNKKFEDSPIVNNQGNSLIQTGLELDYFFIKGQKIWGYLRNLFLLRKYLRRHNYDIIHAHYSLSGFITSFAGRNPVVVSLMGSDVHRHAGYRLMIRLLSRAHWAATIVKSEEMKKLIGIDFAHIIPNGVDISKFIPAARDEVKERVGFRQGKHVIFVGNPKRPEKNYHLAEESISRLRDKNVTLHVLSQQPHEKLPDFMNAADALLLTSIYEGSPNVIKEAMACNCPIVATRVGDAEWVIGDTEGCYLTSFAPEDVASKIQMALNFGRRTRGRKRLIELGLESGAIAKKIIQVYQSVIK